MTQKDEHVYMRMRRACWAKKRLFLTANEHLQAKCTFVYTFILKWIDKRSEKQLKQTNLNT